MLKSSMDEEQMDAILNSTTTYTVTRLLLDSKFHS